ncbi:MAG: diaminopimelate epimerase [Deltaproteobacteria bacterium]|nr:diaminopimelate epimerase [Deltaproteobacteria bacterium]
MPTLRFTKMHGLGNDYVYVDACAQSVRDPAALARRVSPRHTGVGADGLILICPSSVADCRMEMYNADGSRGLMCGNGIRCVGKYAYEHGLARRNPLRVETDAGIKELQLHLRGERVAGATVDMGEPITEGPRIPVAAAGRVIDAALEVGGQSYRITCVSMGNPHCVVWVDDADGLALETIGPRFEHHPFFPQRVNTEFVTALSPRELRLRVWERGSGETQACGTGACAAVVAGVLNGKNERRATVHLRGGDLEIEWREANGRVLMTGPAEEVFSGELEVA